MRAGRDLIVMDAEKHPHLKTVRPAIMIRNIMADGGIDTRRVSEGL